MRDLEEIGRTIALDRPLVARRMIERLLAVAESLADHPKRGARPKDKRLRTLGFRFLVERPHLLFYKVGDKVVLVYRVLHGHQRYQGLL